MAILRVAKLGNPILRKIAEPINEKDIKSPKIKTLIEDMIQTMFEYDGRGLAAPQVHESLQLVVMIWDFDETADPYIRCLINPVITPLTEETAPFWEGCLSVPGMRGKVARPTKISVEALDQTGKKSTFVAEGFAATVIQHECDHLLGKIYVDRLIDPTQFAFNREYSKFIAKAEQEEAAE